MRTCERGIWRVDEPLVCGRPCVTTRRITIMTAASALADLEYVVDLCAEHAAEYDRDHV